MRKYNKSIQFAILFISIVNCQVVTAQPAFETNAFEFVSPLENELYKAFPIDELGENTFWRPNYSPRWTGTLTYKPIWDDDPEYMAFRQKHCTSGVCGGTPTPPSIWPWPPVEPPETLAALTYQMSSSINSIPGGIRLANLDDLCTDASCFSLLGASKNYSAANYNPPIQCEYGYCMDIPTVPESWPKFRFLPDTHAHCGATDCTVTPLEIGSRLEADKYQDCRVLNVCGGKPTEEFTTVQNYFTQPSTFSSLIAEALVDYSRPIIIKSAAANIDLPVNPPMSFPGTVALLYENENIDCSGVLLSQNKIVTAAHCVCKETPLSVYFGHSYLSGRALEGVLSETVPVLDKVQFYDADYCSKTDIVATGIDLALLTLREQLPVGLYDHIRSVETAISDLAHTVTSLHVAGFGESDARYRTGVKHTAELDFVKRLCDALGYLTYSCIPDVESVASRPPADTCYGDSGGGLYTYNKDNNSMMLIGITSRSIDEKIGCGLGGIYTSLESELVENWLIDNQ